MKFLYTAHITKSHGGLQFYLSMNVKARPQHRELRPLLLRTVCGFFNAPQSNHEQGL